MKRPSKILYYTNIIRFSEYSKTGLINVENMPINDLYMAAVNPGGCLI